MVAQVEHSLRSQDEILRVLKDSLATTQHWMKMNADCYRRELEFAPGDFVYLQLQPFQQLSVRTRGNMKLSPCFYGPYQVMERVGQVAYRLALPTDSRIHPVFHVSQLKKQLGHLNQAVQELPKVQDDGKLLLEPAAILDYHWSKAGKKVL